MASLVVAASGACTGTDGGSFESHWPSAESGPQTSETTTVSRSEEPGAIERGLQTIPAAAFGAVGGERPSVAVEIADIQAIAESQGLAPPAPGRDDDAIVEFLGATRRGDPDRIASAITLEWFAIWDAFVLGGVGAFADETGVDIGAVERFAAVDDEQTGRFAVFGGDLELSEGLDDVGGGVVSLGDGDDVAEDPDARTGDRRVGPPLRFAQMGDEVAQSGSTLLVEQWVADDSESLADDANFAAVARAMDAEGAISSSFMTGDFSFRPEAIAGPLASQERLDIVREEYSDAEFIEERFDLVAIGGADVGGEVRSVVAYLFDDDATATAAIESIRQIWTSGDMLDSKMSVGEIPDDVEVASDGRVVLVTSAVAETASTGDVVDLALRRSTMFSHR